MSAFARIANRFAAVVTMALIAAVAVLILSETVAADTASLRDRKMPTLAGVAERAATALDTGRAAAAAVGAGSRTPTYVQFRELFNSKGKPSLRAVSLAGQRIEMIGFMTPAPAEHSPFIVLVGAPTHRCPYCSEIGRAHV